MFKNFTMAAIAVSLVATPTISAAQSAAPAPAVETMDSNSALRGGFILPLAAMAAIVLAVLLLTRDDEESEPVTP